MARLAKPKRVIVYADQEGNEPFTDWLYGLKDRIGRKRVLIRIARLEQENYGDCEPVGDGISELRRVHPTVVASMAPRAIDDEGL